MESFQSLSSQRGERRALRMREAILDAGQRILARHGSAALSCEAVAEAADVSIQTVYNRVGRKDDLLMALAERAMEANQRYMDEAYTLTGDARTRIEGALEAYIRFALERPDAFLTLALPPDRVSTDRANAMRQRQNGLLAEALAAGQAMGQIDQALDPGICATTLWAMWNGLLVSMLYRDRLGLHEDEMARVFDLARDLLRHALTGLVDH